MSSTRPTGNQMTADYHYVGALVLVPVQLAILYFVSSKTSISTHYHHMPTEIFTLAFVETILLTFFLLSIALLQTILFVWGLALCAGHLLSARWRGEEYHLPVRKRDLILLAASIPACTVVALTAAVASRPLNAGILEGSKEILRIIFPFILTTPFLAAGLWTLHRGYNSDLLRPPSQLDHAMLAFSTSNSTTSSFPRSIAKRKNDRHVWILGLLLLPIYTLLIYYPPGNSPSISVSPNVMDPRLILSPLIRSVTTFLTLGLVVLFSAVAVQEIRRRRMRARTRRMQP